MSKAVVTETATPGTFYHGSRTWGLSEILSEAQALTLAPGAPFTEANHGIYFSDSQYYASAYARQGGAVYSVALNTKNAKRIAGSLEALLSADDVEAYRAQDIDCLVCSVAGYTEFVVFDPGAVTIIDVSETLVEKLEKGRQVEAWANGKLPAESVTADLFRLCDRLSKTPSGGMAWRALMQRVSAKQATLDELINGRCADGVNDPDVVRQIAWHKPKPLSAARSEEGR